MFDAEQREFLTRNRGARSEEESAAALGAPRRFRVILIAALLVMAAKLVLSYKVYGLNAEMPFWLRFGEEIHEFGTFEIYRTDPFFNHPPLTAWILELVMCVKDATGLGFPFLFRLVPILADFCLVLVVWRLIEHYDIRNGLTVGLVCALTPVNFMVSGFQGNTDPLLILCLALSLLALEKRKHRTSGLLFGLGLCVKLSPLVMVPFLLFRPARLREKAEFFLCSAGAPLAVFLPYYLHDKDAFSQNVLSYSAILGTWGIGRILLLLNWNATWWPSLQELAGWLYDWHGVAGKWLIFGGLAVLFACVIDLKRIHCSEAFFFSLAWFLVVTPGFGLQYLLWISFFSVLTFQWMGIAYNALAGLYLFSAYTALLKGTDIPHSTVALEITVWIWIVAMTAVFVSRKNRHRGRLSTC